MINQRENLQLPPQLCDGATHREVIPDPDKQTRSCNLIDLKRIHIFTPKSLSTEPSGSFAKAEFVGAKTVKGGSRLVPLGKATVMAASKVEKRLSVASTSPVVGNPAAGENGLKPGARPEGGRRATPPSCATTPPPGANPPSPPPGVQHLFRVQHFC